MPGIKRFKDEFDHVRHKAYSKAKAQADFRGEGWQLNITDWFYLWRDPKVWSQRGRGKDDLCMTRLDDNGPWSLENIVIVTRLAHLNEKNAKNSGRFGRNQRYKEYDIL